MTHYQEYAIIADENRSKKIAQIAVGDFVWGVTGNGKETNICELVRSTSGRPVLLNVVEIREVSKLPLAEFLQQKPPRNRGGSRSDDVPDGVPVWSLTREQIGTYYQCVTMYRCGDKALYVDCQGCNYWRYVYMPTNYACMYAEAYKIARCLTEAREAEREADKQLKRAIVTARTAELRAAWYNKLQERPGDSRVVSANVRAYLESFGVVAKVAARNSYCSGYDVTITLTDAAQSDNVDNLMSKWVEQLPTGETERYGVEIQVIPFAIFGLINKYTVK